LVKNPEAYRVVGRFALADVGYAAFCDQSRNPVFEQGVYGRDSELR
jgi:hypothetical protein